MDFFVVFMDCLRHVAVKKEWLSNPVVGSKAVMFFSNDENAIANFEMDPEYLLNERQQGNYDVFVLKSFGMTLI